MTQETPKRSVLAEVRGLLPPRPLTTREATAVLERQASRLLKLMDFAGPPVPMNELLAGLPRIVVQRSEGLATSGRTQWDGVSWVMMVAADEPHVRQRFTLAHELAHIVLHPISDIALPGSDHQTAEARLEASCEYFAACLLMPRLWMKRAYFHNGIQDVPSLARLFGVSWLAMRIRLERLGFVAEIETRSTA
jgi:predicted transcriptional regulator